MNRTARKATDRGSAWKVYTGALADDIGSRWGK